MKKIVDRNQVVHELTLEVVNGMHDKEVLKNSSEDFSGETQATYFSNARKHMSSDIFYMIANQNQQLDEVNIRNLIRGNC